jgi:DNA-binding NarL/FixJ family response regulator
MTLLIVEDHSGMRALIRSVVGTLVTDVFECGDGADALAAYTAHRPDMVLMDIALPSVDGISATRQIRAIDPAARVVIVTDYDGPGLRDEARQAGACAYVLKERLLDIRPLIRGASEIH